MALHTGSIPLSDGQEAIYLMFYHLRIAALLFEATDLNPEIPTGEFSAPAMRAWLEQMEALYPEEA